MKSTPEQTKVNVTKEDSDRINDIYIKLKSSGMAVKKYDLWGEAVKLLKNKMIDSNGDVKI